jgi:fatty acid desaturase
VIVFPILEGIAFVLACGLGAAHPLSAGLAFLAAALMLCVSVHVSVHEAVHQHHLARFPGAGALFSIVMGLPFEGYRWHHMNHHRWNNRLEDYSTTWRETAFGPRPWPLLRYVLEWPRQLARSAAAMRAAAAGGQLSLTAQRAVRAQKHVLLVFLVSLVLLAPRIALAYLALVYVGWALIALQNYGQHPPRAYGAETATSYHASLYNRLLFRNGLHAEHHEQPQLPWHLLEARAEVPIRRPHLLQPFERGRRA